MIDELVNLANHLDSKGLSKEADYLDHIIKEARIFANNRSSWPSQMWPYQKDLVSSRGVLRAIAKARRLRNDNISKKCADRDAVKKLSCGLGGAESLGNITFRHFKDDNFCYAIAEIKI